MSMWIAQSMVQTPRPGESEAPRRRRLRYLDHRLGDPYASRPSSNFRRACLAKSCFILFPTQGQCEARHTAHVVLRPPTASHQFKELRATAELSMAHNREWSDPHSGPTEVWPAQPQGSPADFP